MTTTDSDDRKGLARHWLREMAASNAIEGNPFDEKDFALFEQMIEAGLTPEQMVERITAQARADQQRR